MQQSDELLKQAAATLEKYRKNRTLVPAEDLAGKYKVAFEKLKTQLKDQLSDYLKAYSLEQIYIDMNSNGFQTFVDTVNRIFTESDVGKRVGKAAFKEYDLEKVKQIAEELRLRVYEEAYVPYLQKGVKNGAGSIDN